MTRAVRAAVLLVAHGTVDALDDLPELLANIRRGHPAPPALLAEVRRRYEAIGGQSPLNAINREIATKLEARLGVPVRFANRLFRPYPKDVLAALAAEGVDTIIVVPLAQHSAHVYGDAVKAAAKSVPGIAKVIAAPNWGRTPELTRAFAHAVEEALAKAGGATVVFTAHSLPLDIIAAGDAYEREVRGSAEDVAKAIGGSAPWTVCFQSQGLTPGQKWLGPDLRETLEALAQQGVKAAVLAPIGFLADHVEILYDLDIEAKSWGRELGIETYRSASLNAGDALVSALATVASGLLREAG